MRKINLMNLKLATTGERGSHHDDCDDIGGVGEKTNSTSEYCALCGNNTQDYFSVKLKDVPNFIMNHHSKDYLAALKKCARKNAGELWVCGDCYTECKGKS